MESLKHYFETGLTKEAYFNHMQVNRSESESIYNAFHLDEADARLQIVREKASKVIVITEDWCGDAMMNIPVLLRIAEATDLDVKFSLRDSNLDLMDTYLTNGTARSIPIFIFLNDDFEEVAKWGPRAQVVQDYVTEVRSDLPEKSHPEFEALQKEKHHQIHDKYLNTPEFWEAVKDDILNQFN